MITTVENFVQELQLVLKAVSYERDGFTNNMAMEVVEECDGLTSVSIWPSELGEYTMSIRKPLRDLLGAYSNVLMYISIIEREDESFVPKIVFSILR